MHSKTFVVYSLCFDCFESGSGHKVAREERLEIRGAALEAARKDRPHIDSISLFELKQKGNASIVAYAIAIILGPNIVHIYVYANAWAALQVGTDLVGTADRCCEDAWNDAHGALNDCATAHKISHTKTQDTSFTETFATVIGFTSICVVVVSTVDDNSVENDSLSTCAAICAQRCHESCWAWNQK